MPRMTLKWYGTVASKTLICPRKVTEFDLHGLKNGPTENGISPSLSRLNEQYTNVIQNLRYNSTKLSCYWSCWMLKIIKPIFTITRKDIFETQTISQTTNSLQH